MSEKENDQTSTTTVGSSSPSKSPRRRDEQHDQEYNNLVTKFAVSGTKDYVSSFEAILMTKNAPSLAKNRKRRRILPPITNVALVPEGTPCPRGYQLIEETIVSRSDANLNAGRWTGKGLYLAIERARHRPAVIDIVICANDPKVILEWTQSGYQIARNLLNGDPSLNKQSTNHNVVLVYRTQAVPICHESLYDPEPLISDIYVHIPAYDGYSIDKININDTKRKKKRRRSRVVTTSEPIDVNQGSLMGKEVYIRWNYAKRDGLLDVSFPPEILDECPSKDVGPYRLPAGVAHFCFPRRVHLVRDEVQPMPTWFTFALTDARAGQLYCSCLQFYEPLDDKIVMELEALKMAYEIGLQSTRHLPTEKELTKMIREEYESLKNNDDKSLEERVRLRVYEEFDGDIFVAVRPLTRSLIKEMYDTVSSKKKLYDKINVDSTFREDRT
jgi:hypothetical protein